MKTIENQIEKIKFYLLRLKRLKQDVETLKKFVQNQKICFENKKKIKEHVCLSCGSEFCFVGTSGGGEISGLRTPFSLPPKNYGAF